MPNWDTATRVTTDTLRRRSTLRDDETLRFGELFKLLPAMTEGLLRHFNTTAVKCSTSAETMLTVTQDMERAPFFLTSSKGKVRGWIEVERSFSLLLCDLALGGSGIEADVGDEARPQTQFETALAIHFVDMLVKQLPAVIKELRDLDVQVSEPDPQEIKTFVAEPRRCANIRILANAFGLSGEINIAFVEEDLLRLLGPLKELSTVSRLRGRDALKKCKFRLDVLFSPVTVPLHHMMILEPGAVLKLDIHPQSMVTIKCNGVTILSGQLRTSGGKQSVMLDESKTLQ